jgi:hypothetical protein
VESANAGTPSADAEERAAVADEGVPAGEAVVAVS